MLPSVPLCGSAFTSPAFTSPSQFNDSGAATACKLPHNLGSFPASKRSPTNHIIMHRRSTVTLTVG
ncbi:predicted protein [Plenodomus lingam JN3]|uniref:Predicted protein n=1 Tax=Leptosphaeria maculans (strain JN3 / isolate v23.1.3 / race Av1-4-5-6-7-8) TaxID=985895 RepID=E4ZJX5_LEPMJ|nr:predicted protein [Plenodomus lingam JN3]CBX91410.1 predicted protein [Plenodomus lingam JN3]